MKNIIIYGYGYEGVGIYRELSQSEYYNIVGFADDETNKKDMYVNGNKIKTLQELTELKKQMDFSVIVVSKYWMHICLQLVFRKIRIEGVYIRGKVRPEIGQAMTFEQLDLEQEIKLYAGDIVDNVHLAEHNLYGLSINKADSKHILHDITVRYPLPDNCISSYQAEDVIEHIPFEKVVSTIDEIYRVLKSGGVFRLCLPDYYSPYLKSISMVTKEGNIVYDPTGGGGYGKAGVIDGGHLWFPTYDKVLEILKQTKFKNFEFLCYHRPDTTVYFKEIDFTKGYISRVFQRKREDTYSIVVDCYK